MNNREPKMKNIRMKKPKMKKPKTERTKVPKSNKSYGKTSFGMTKRKRPVMHERKPTIRKDGTPVRGSTINPNLLRQEAKRKLIIRKKELITKRQEEHQKLLINRKEQERLMRIQEQDIQNLIDEGIDIDSNIILLGKIEFARQEYHKEQVELMKDSTKYYNELIKGL